MASTALHRYAIRPLRTGFGMRLSNCLIYALGRFIRSGGYLVVRRSRHGWYPHFLWSGDLKTFEQFVPVRGVDYTLLPPPMFAGYVRKGSDDL